MVQTYMKEEMFHGNPIQQGFEIQTQYAQTSQYADKEIVVHSPFVLQIALQGSLLVWLLWCSLKFKQGLAFKYFYLGDSACEPLMHAFTVHCHKGCLSTILFGTGPLQHLHDALSIDILLDLLDNIRLTFAHPVHWRCSLLEALFRTSSEDTTGALK